MNYKAIQARASAGIKFFSDADGVFNKYTKGAGGGIDPETGKDIIPGEVVMTIKGAIRNVNDSDINGETILAGDKRGFFTHDVPIMEGDEIEVDGERYRVVNARPVKPTGTVVAYRPVLRRVATYG